MKKTVIILHGRVHLKRNLERYVLLSKTAAENRHSEAYLELPQLSWIRYFETIANKF